jgi:hypothetical protein
LTQKEEGKERGVSPHLTFDSRFRNGARKPFHGVIGAINMIFVFHSVDMIAVFFLETEIRSLVAQSRTFGDHEDVNLGMDVRPTCDNSISQ